MLRILLALTAAAGITLFLFYLMQSLIQSGNGALSDPPQGNVLDFVRLKKEEAVEKKQRKPNKPPKPDTPPPSLVPPSISNDSLSGEGSTMSFAADVATEMAIGSGLSLDSGDGEYLPIVKVAPVYPRRALSRGIEGYVIVEFTVNKQGAVTDPLVVKANPESIFDRAAMDAALKFKYKPRVVNGEAVEVQGVQNRITFEIKG
ncbi:energy transducer TonB [Flocculibacter collagenilyticus]|uniref:energy transducer TonB n=1 Tax=Flocculibacter collagenilyticus TaxID=2744479 RepID=UPI0018F3502A|nr:energy transducer TonB [Flocculibacter collagenilyticus]